MSKPKKKQRPRGGATVACPHCDGPTRVLRTMRDGPMVRRVRQCARAPEAHGRFFTVEVLSRDAPRRRHR